MLVPEVRVGFIREFLELIDVPCEKFKASVWLWRRLPHPETLVPGAVQTDFGVQTDTCSSSVKVNGSQRPLGTRVFAATRVNSPSLQSLRDVRPPSAADLQSLREVLGLSPNGGLLQTNDAIVDGVAFIGTTPTWDSVIGLAPRTRSRGTTELTWKRHNSREARPAVSHPRLNPLPEGPRPLGGRLPRRRRSAGARSSRARRRRTARHRRPAITGVLLAVETGDQRPRLRGALAHPLEHEKDANTVRDYKERLGAGLPALGHFKVRELHRRHIKVFLAEKRGRATRKNTVRLMRAALSAMLSDAVDDGIIWRTPPSASGGGRRAAPIGSRRPSACRRCAR